MKKLLLFISILISSFGFWWILKLNFFSLSFSYEDFIFYLVFAFVSYLIIRWVGGSLNKKFNDVVDSFLKDNSTELKIDKKLISNFGFLLISLLPFLAFILLISLFAAIDFSLLGFSLISGASRVPVALLLALIVIPFGALIGVIIGFYRLVVPSRQESDGIKVKRGKQIKLWSLIDEVAFYLKTPRVDEVILTPTTTIGVYLKGNNIAAMFGKGIRVLEIGLPSIEGLTIGEFKSILTHEYGHLSNKDTQWSAFTYAMAQALINALASSPGPSREKSKDGEEKSGGIYEGVIALNPAWWILYFYVKLYFAVTGGFQRLKEVRADLNAIELTGGEDFAKGLKKIVINDYIFDEYIQKHLVWDMLKKNQVVNNFSKIMNFATSNLKGETLWSIENEAIVAEKPSEWDTHPAVKIRLEYASRFKSAVKSDEDPISKLFDNWDEINERIADLYNKRLISILKAYSDSLREQKEQADNDSKGKSSGSDDIFPNKCPKCGKRYSSTVTKCRYCKIKLVEG